MKVIGVQILLKGSRFEWQKCPHGILRQLEKEKNSTKMKEFLVCFALFLGLGL